MNLSLFAKLLPDVVECQEWRDFGVKLSNGRLVWKSHKLPVVKTEYSELCHLAEERLDGEIAKREYVYALTSKMESGQFTVMANMATTCIHPRPNQGGVFCE